MNKFKTIIVLVVVIIMIILIFQNSQPVTTKLLFATVAMPVSALIGVSMLVGMALGIVVALRLNKRKKDSVKTSPPEKS